MPFAETIPHALPPGTQLEEFEILSIIGAGGFGIVYLALDNVLQRRIAIKEYMPAQFASRSAGDTTVIPRTSRDLETFQVGLRSFINEGRLLAQFEHPSLVKVHRFWQANGTAYMAMPVYGGLTLKQTRDNMVMAPQEPWLRSLLEPLLDACATLHTARCYHRDISPENIILTNGRPILLDFGAARQVIGDATRTLTIILREGYAPIEQYGSSSSMSQGPWTDIYALCCVVRYCITGKAPQPSVQRLIDDPMQLLSELYVGQFSRGFLAAIDAGLMIKPGERPQSIAQFRNMLDVAPDAVVSISTAPDNATQVRPNSASNRPEESNAAPIELRSVSISPQRADQPQAPESVGPGTLRRVAVGVVVIALFGAAAVAWKRLQSEIVTPKSAAIIPATLDPKHPLHIGTEWYPAEAKRAKQQGRCIIKMTVSSTGAVINESLQQSTGYPSLDNACLKAVHGQRIRPATKNGVPITTITWLPIDWTLTDCSLLQSVISLGRKCQER
jgi:hypothetical protein